MSWPRITKPHSVFKSEAITIIAGPSSTCVTSASPSPSSHERNKNEYNNSCSSTIFIMVHMSRKINIFTICKSILYTKIQVTLKRFNLTVRQKRTIKEHKKKFYVALFSSTLWTRSRLQMKDKMKKIQS